MQAGSIHLITGCMFAGKTTRLMDKACAHPNEEILVVKHASDTRYGSQSVLYTHSSRTLPCVVANRMKDVMNHPAYVSANHIFIDEGQFFDDLVDFCKAACDMHGKHIHIAALNGDSNRMPFPNVANLIPMVDTTETLYAYCERCGMASNIRALFSYRKSTSLDRSSLDVGASDKYEALCRYHFIKASGI